MNMMNDVQSIEKSIQILLDEQRIRLNDFFVDWDSLRSGFVTKQQFIRCLNLACQNSHGLNLTQMEVEKLVAKYLNNSTSKDMVCYRDFLNNINQHFNQDLLHPKPPVETQILAKVPYLKSIKSEIPNKTLESKFVYKILEKIAFYYFYRKLDIQSMYKDFDKVNCGLITKSVFIRFFPVPEGCTEKDIVMLSNYYQDPKNSLYCNYLNFCYDIKKLIKSMYESNQNKLQKGIPKLIKNEKTSNSTEKALSRLRIMVYKNGIRTQEFFQDYDKLNHGVITRNQFFNGLKLCVERIGTEPLLTNQEINLIADYYSETDGLVKYKHFCLLMEHAFNVPRLDKKPVVLPLQPPSGALSRNLSILKEEDENDLKLVLYQIKKKIYERRLEIQSYLKDFDKSKAYSRTITKFQFSRVLHNLNLLPPQHYFNLLCKKFCDPRSGDISYNAFCQEVDINFHHQSIEKLAPIPELKYQPKFDTPLLDVSKVEVNEIINRIRHLCTVKQIRLSEFFNDWDNLHSGLVFKTVFARCIHLMGVNWLNDVEVLALKERYEDKDKPEMCSWVEFKNEIEGFMEPKDLEQHPYKNVFARAHHIMPKKGAVTKNNIINSKIQSLFAKTMNRLREKAIVRKINLRPTFQDFDTHQLGHVSKFQWLQILKMLGFEADEDELKAIWEKFSDSYGFNWKLFLENLLPQEEEIDVYPKIINHMIKLNLNKKPSELNPLESVEEIIFKCKVKNSKERQRPHEFFKDFDKLRKGVISKDNFCRAVDLMKLQLKESEVAKVANFYQSLKKPGFVQYKLFCDEIERVFTINNLEKLPTVTPSQFKPPVDWHCNILNDNEENQLMVVLNRIAKWVKENRTQLYQYFEDHEVTHTGHCSKDVFSRVLSKLNLQRFYNSQDCSLICKRFEVIRGEVRDINFSAFCDTIYDIAGFVPNNP